eukprot:9658554-Lingulodinium_polyedra.AAC.1
MAPLEGRGALVLAAQALPDEEVELDPAAAGVVRASISVHGPSAGPAEAGEGGEAAEDAASASSAAAAPAAGPSGAPWTSSASSRSRRSNSCSA